MWVRLRTVAVTQVILVWHKDVEHMLSASVTYPAVLFEKVDIGSRCLSKRVRFVRKTRAGPTSIHGFYRHITSLREITNLPVLAFPALLNTCGKVLELCSTRKAVLHLHKGKVRWACSGALNSAMTAKTQSPLLTYTSSRMDCVRE